MNRFTRLTIIICLLADTVAAGDGQWFKDFKRDASPEQLYTFLYAMPKGGDLHHHLTGSNFSEWWYAAATDQNLNGGYQYYTKIKINNCLNYGSDMFGPAPYLLLFRNIQQSEFKKLSDCEKTEFKKLEDLNKTEKLAWLNSIRLDKEHEGRDELFQAHWQRLNDVAANPYINAEMIVKNMQALAAEGVVYLEIIDAVHLYRRVDGSLFAADEVADLFRRRIRQADALATGVTVRMQHFLLRFLPHAEQDLEVIYRFVDRNRDLFVAIDMVGREDNDKGYPLRFLPTLRKMRRQIPQINLSIHAGEVDEPNRHVRDTLLLGAQRIGHGVNLIDDADTMLLLRNGETLVEINLISNLLLGYVDDYSEHPFPEYLRTGIPVALSTDDRGMWDSNLTDEFYVAVKEFNLSWQEILTLGENSLQHAFVEQELKQALLKDYHKRVSTFAKRFRSKGMKALANVRAKNYSFTCKRYQVCF